MVNRLFRLLLLAAVFGVGPTRADQLECAATAAVCEVRKRVLHVVSRDIVGSAVDLGGGIVVTNRHIVADSRTATVVAGDGRKFVGRVVPSSYAGDLILLSVDGLNPQAAIAGPVAQVEPDTAVRIVAYDREAGHARYYESGDVLLSLPPDKPLARLQHDAPGGAGNSGGLLIDESGSPVGIVTAGREQRGEAIPLTEIDRLRAVSGAGHEEAHARISKAYKDCMDGLRHAPPRRGRLPQRLVDHLIRNCSATRNRQLISGAGEALGRAGYLEEARELFATALDADPYSLDARQSLVVVLQLSGRHAEAIPHIRWLMGVLPTDSEILRLAIQAGKISGDGAVAEEAYGRLKQAHPALAVQIRRFLDSPLPTGSGPK